MIRNKWLILAIIIIILVLGIILVKSSRNNSNSKTKQQIPSPTENLQITPSESTPTESPTPYVTITPTEAASSNTISTQPGGPSGQITCNYQIPPDPNNYGSASIDSNWNNLILAKNGTAKAAVCVSVNGASSLMSIDLQQKGSRTTEINWIILNASYTFNLYDDHGGDLPDCGGAVLATCKINTIVPPTPALRQPQAR